jgi:hypothetical protein
MMADAPAQVDLAISAGTARRRRKLVGAATVGLVGALLTPLPATAAPAPCEQAERYAAQSGAEAIRIDKLDLRPAGRSDAPVTGIGVGDAKSALVAQSAVNTAAIGRVLDSGPAGRQALAGALVQQAPPTNEKPNRRATEATEAGPFRVGAGEVTTHAQWEPGMACGARTGEATRAKTQVSRAAILADDDGALVAVPARLSSLSTTALERRGSATRTVAAASLDASRIDLLNGAVTIKIIRTPTLRASMSTEDGGEIRYLPAVIEVSGPGHRTTRLDTAGDTTDLALARPQGRPTRRAQAATSPDAAQNGTAHGDPKQPDTGQADISRGGTGLDKPGTGRANAAEAGRSQTERTAAEEVGAGQNGTGRGAAGKNGPADDRAGRGGTAEDDAGLLSGLPRLDAIGSTPPLSLPGAIGIPDVPGVPPVGQPGTEAAPAAGPGTAVRVSLGDVRQAASGHAIAAKATAVTVTIAHSRQPHGRGAEVVLNLELGLLEVAAVAPEPAHSTTSGVAGGAGGTLAGGLPITGPRVDLIALAGVALLVAGVAALLFGLRSRPRP